MKLRSESDLGRDGDGRTSLLSLSVPPFPPTRSVTDPINPVSESRVSSRPLLRARAPQLRPSMTSESRLHFALPIDFQSTQKRTNTILPQ